MTEENSLQENRKDSEIVNEPKRHTKKWYINNWGVDPLRLNLRHKQFKNPHYKKGAPMRLWNEEVVLPFKTEEAIVAHKRRAAGAKKAATTRRERLLAEVINWDIELKREPFQEVIKKAIDAYNLRLAYREIRGDCLYEPASIDSDRELLNRIINNYLRHELSSYEARLDDIFGKTGTSTAYSIIRKKINEKILEVYPELISLETVLANSKIQSDDK